MLELEKNVIEKLTDRISVVFTESGFTFGNGVLIEDKKRVMIDSGMGDVLSSVQPDKVDILINSHCHIDHISGNDHFINATIMAHPIEKESMMDPEMTTATKGWDSLMDLDRESRAMDIGILNPRYALPWRVDKEVQGNQYVDCGKTTFQILHTPGHTSGHLSFWFPDEEFVFTGDICLSAVGPWYGDPTINLGDFIQSIERLIALKPRYVATGHINHLIDKDIPELFTEYAGRIFHREKRILSFLEQKPLGIDELAAKRPIYREHPSDFVLFWEKAMILKHLEHLADRGCVHCRDDGRYVHGGVGPSR